MVKQLFLLLLIPFFIGTAQAADIRVYVDRQNINVNESFNLVFEADGDVDAAPDFSPLSVYFDVLSKNQSSNMSIINGNFSRKTVWTLVLLAKQAGNYALPAIEFGNDVSPVLNIKIHKSSATTSAPDSNLFLEAEINSNSAYVQSQLIYTVRLFRAVDIQNASLTEPELSDADAIVEKLGEDKRYQTTRNGVRFVVIERRYAIFPQQSGQLSIKPVEFNGQIVSQRRSFFDRMPLNNVTKRLYSKQIDLIIKPVPASFKNKHWLPSTEIKLVDEWPDSSEFKVGEPVTRTITLMAIGLTAAQLPEISGNEIDGVKQYPDQPALNDNKDKNGILGVRQEKIAFIPTQSGTLTLPELNIPWWNTKTEKMEYARIEPKNITVLAGNKVNTSSQLPVKTSDTTATITAVNTVSSDNVSNFWFYSSIVLLIGWLSTLYFLFRNRAEKAVNTDIKKAPSLSLNNINKKVISACHQNNAVLCKSLLIEWAKQRWPEKSFTSLGDVSSQVDGDLQYQINKLNQSLYSDSGENWQADDLKSAFEKDKGKPLDQAHGSQNSLKPLHKLIKNNI